jgi:hypothetical protein
MSAFDKWDAIRLLLGLALGACNIGVWRGVRLEESSIPWEKETGKILLIRSLALEAFFAFALLAVDTTASLIQKAEIASANRATEELRQENLKLQAKVIWRQLTSDQCRTLVAILQARQSAVVIEYPLGDPEAVLFAIGFENCFGLNAHWQVLTAAVAFKDVLPLNLTVTGQPGQNLNAVKAWLNQVGLQYGVDDRELEHGVIARFGASAGSGEIKIMVGSRPVF